MNRMKECLLTTSMLLAAAPVAAGQGNQAEQQARLQMLQDQAQYLEMQARQEEVLQNLRAEQRMQQAQLQQHIQDVLREQRFQLERMQIEQRLHFEEQMNRTMP